MIKKILSTLVLCSLPVSIAIAGSAAVALDKAPINLHDKASLQRGAKIFVNYCGGCHSAEFMRYNRLAKDIGILDADGEVDEALVKQNLIFTGVKVADTMISSMPKADAAKWFGKAPPDLTLMARVRGADWLYSYMRGFYKDDSKTWGVNNRVFKDVGMPHVLANLQGIQAPVYRTETHFSNGSSEKVQVLDHLEMAEPGILSPEEYDRFVGDLVNFMVYMGEPGKLQRQHIGVFVLLFLGILFVLAYLLKKEYWKDVHK